jgi:vacuolar-type H+-ATPase subunit I/STV1
MVTPQPETPRQMGQQPSAGQHVPGPLEARPSSVGTRGMWVLGLTLFAGVTMIVIGFFHIITGVVALFRNRIYVAGPEYVFAFGLTGWGWIHIIGGIIVGLTGLGLLAGQPWARVVGIVLASLSMIANFIFIPYYPLWSLLMVALDIFVIWALAVYSREMAGQGGEMVAHR